MGTNNFGRDIRALRTKRGMGSRELSRLVGKAETYISQLERGLIKKPDYNTAFEIVKLLGFTESGIDKFLESFYQIKSPLKIAAEAEDVENLDEARAAKIEEMWTQRQEDIDNDQEYHVNNFEKEMVNIESEWMIELIDKLKRRNEEIKMELSFNIDKNAQTFEPVINNLYSLLTSMRKDRGNFNFFVGLFENDLSILSQESKDKILKVVKEEMDEKK
ncbi:helix-turn-helix domain-containing protein [Metabacillus dongyingensis]|uniref:helix-turn-helix domain-containing protein n=1 Tax=Metabacillus dongyingensis TaxID=2874282 RepID=UPI001CC09303|nr:helix-turn-helix transcriptional regulator [Metabacillus dongyingensis]UAL54464.1 helix-turn-helix domain-containing protein [Metabacillus dongyingensis]